MFHHLKRAVLKLCLYFSFFMKCHYLISGEKSKEHAYPATICPVNVFFLFILNRFNAENITILLSMLWQANHFPFGAGVTEGILCIVGSAMYFISTGISLETSTFEFRKKKLKITHHSQTLRLLSSEVVTNLRLSSTKVMLLTAPKCLSYSCTTSPERISH